MAHLDLRYDRKFRELLSRFKVKGAMQLYSRERGVSQPIEGHAATFAEVKLDGNQHVTKLFTFSVRTGNGAKVCVVVSRAVFFLGDI